jgi:hypothetical protein
MPSGFTRSSATSFSQGRIEALVGEALRALASQALDFSAPTSQPSLLPDVPFKGTTSATLVSAKMRRASP